MNKIMNKTSSFLVKGSLVALSFVVFSGCDFFKKKEATTAGDVAGKAGDTVLLTIDGEAVLKESDFMANVKQMMEANPYFRDATIETLPKELLRKVFDQLYMQHLIEKEADQNNIEKNAEYIKAYNSTEPLLKRSLKVQIYQKQIFDNIKVNDADIEKYFNENKDRFVKEKGGVLTQGVRFESEAQANAFLLKAKGDVEAFEKLGKAEKAGSFKDFGRVNREAARGMQFDATPAPIKEAALAMVKLPGIEKVKAGKEFWVIKAWDKKEKTLFAVDEIKPQIESMLKQNTYKDEFEKTVKELKDKKHKVIINEEFFKEKVKPGEAPKDEANNGNKPADTKAVTAA
jgi:hypothetical protein